MDGAGLGSIDISINKPFAARAFDLPPGNLAEDAGPGEQFFGIHASNHRRVMIFAGRVPITSQGQVMSAVEVSGGTGEQVRPLPTPRPLPFPAGLPDVIDGGTMSRGRHGGVSSQSVSARCVQPFPGNTPCREPR